MSNAPDIAEKLFSRSYNCAQAVFATFAAQCGLDEKTALKTAAPFGGGMARRGEVCGAVTGALMALGLARANPEPEGKEENYRLAREFMDRFEGKNSTLLCRELLKCNLNTPEGRQKAQESGVTRTVCPKAVREAAEIIESMLEAG